MEMEKQARSILEVQIVVRVIKETKQREMVEPALRDIGGRAH